jgi:DNA-directed RNA polymerase specialized sigma24 family protein
MLGTRPFIWWGHMSYRLALFEFAGASNQDDGTRRLLDGVRQHDPCAEAELWQMLFAPLARLISHWLGNRSRAVVDEHDIGVDAMEQLYQRIAAGRCTAIDTCSKLQKLASRCARLRFLAHVRSEQRQKRNVSRDDPVARLRLDDLPGGVPPDFELFPEGDELLAVLHSPEDDKLLEVLNLLSGGCSRAQVAEILKMSLTSVNRHMRQLRARWGERVKKDRPQIGHGVFFFRGQALHFRPDGRWGTH